jgi:hypothetical protein
MHDCKYVIEMGRDKFIDKRQILFIQEILMQPMAFSAVALTNQ